MQREKRNRACKLCDAYRLVALYREPFDVFRFASTSTYRLFHNESAKNTARSKGQGQQNKHRRFRERSNEVTPFHPASRLKSSRRKFVHPAGKNVAVHVSYKTHIASLHYIENFSTYIVSRRSRSPPLSGTFERSHGIFHKHREV